MLDMKLSTNFIFLRLLTFRFLFFENYFEKTYKYNVFLQKHDVEY